MSFALQRYRTSRVETASPVQILVQLYDAAIRHLRDARASIAARDPGRKGVALSKAHAIVSELQATLDHDQAPELCVQLHELYDFCLDRITQANAQWDEAAAEDAARVLGTLREAWSELARTGG